MTMTRCILAAAALLAATLGAGSASAHHSFAMYDSQKLLTVTGTVKEFQWTNPHAILWLYGDGDRGGSAALWSVELVTSPGPLSRLGWSKHSLKAGDKVAVELNPLRDGQKGGSLKKVTVLATGQVLTTSPSNPAVASTGGSGSVSK